MIDELDAPEHKIYEVLRTLSGKAKQRELSAIENRFMIKLEKTTQELYAEVWTEILGGKKDAS
jgi:hypothetical protein